ncbi:diaminopimelate epimerase [Marinimicrococcus flavescens]|uniref:Diaminopimelate epimerase n=1 Tax=Marinimicrococcus flavescens TaxID=3031815 RepID=A0AAP3XSC8_9PROT|nr:diaminopimelate epimerase [Marinimicrococcus flavescens]
MRALPFYKMHGLGNDFVVVDARHVPVELDAGQMRRIADRHRGVGFDQLVRISQALDADARIEFFNSDGTRAGACGNGTRCAARLLFDECPGRTLRLRVGERLLEAERLADGRIAVTMGEPLLDWRDVPVAVPCDTVEMPLDFEDLPHPAGVSMGNPHGVFFVEDLERVEIARVGPLLERHPFFPDRANIGFAQLLGPETIRLRVWERGAGLTLACGSGACAALVSAVRRGLVRERARVLLDGGGELEITWRPGGPVTMTGPAALSFEGVLSAELLDR